MTDLIVPAPLWRRLAAAFYDAFLLIAIWAIAAFMDAIIRDLASLPYDPWLLRSWLFLSGMLFFGWFWTHGGQTLGMRAWRLQLRRADSGPVHWPRAAGRYALAWLSWLPLGLGILWCLLDSRRRSWHDIAFGTEVIVLPATASATRVSSGPAAP